MLEIIKFTLICLIFFFVFLLVNKMIFSLKNKRNKSIQKDIKSFEKIVTLLVGIIRVRFRYDEYSYQTRRNFDETEKLYFTLAEVFTHLLKKVNKNPSDYEVYTVRYKESFQILQDSLMLAIDRKLEKDEAFVKEFFDLATSLLKEDIEISEKIEKKEEIEEEMDRFELVGMLKTEKMVLKKMNSWKQN